jgi:hypothetical protein
MYTHIGGGFPEATHFNSTFSNGLYHISRSACSKMMGGLPSVETQVETSLQRGEGTLTSAILKNRKKIQVRRPLQSYPDFYQVTS